MEYLKHNLGNSTILSYDVMKHIHEYADPLNSIRENIHNLNVGEYFFQYFANNIYPKYSKEELDTLLSIANERIVEPNVEEIYALRYSIFFTPLSWLVRKRICGVITTYSGDLYNCYRGINIWYLVAKQENIKYNKIYILCRMVQQLIANGISWQHLSFEETYQLWLKI